MILDISGVSRNLAAAAACAAVLVASSCSNPTPRPEVLVPGSVMHGILGLALADDGTLYGASILGQAIYHIDPKTGKVEISVGPVIGQSDDVAVGPAGTRAAGIIAWTSAESVNVLRPETAILRITFPVWKDVWSPAIPQRFFIQEDQP